MTSKALIWPAALVGLALVLAGALLFFTGHHVADENKSSDRQDRESDSTRQQPADLPQEPTGSGFASGFTDLSATGFSGPAIPDEEPEAPMQAWELSINKLLDSDEENSKVAQDLASLIPTMPLEGQVEAVQHMVNLLEDDKYSLASNMLLNPAIHPDLRAVIWSDVLDRPNNVKMPVLLSLMNVPGHPARGEAHLKLQEALGRDFGGDAGLWSAPVQAFLAREAEEEAKAEEEAAGMESAPQ